MRAIVRDKYMETEKTTLLYTKFADQMSLRNIFLKADMRQITKDPR